MTWNVCHLLNCCVVCQCMQEEGEREGERERGRDWGGIIAIYCNCKTMMHCDELAVY